MKKTVIILSTIALIAGSCGQTRAKQATNAEQSFSESVIQDTIIQFPKQAEYQPEAVNQNSLEDMIIKTIKAYQNQDETTLNNLISKDFGIAFLYRRGAQDNLSISDKISFDKPVPEYLPYDIDFETDYKIRFEKLPDFSCDNEEWSKSHGIYCDTINIDKKLSTTAKNENEWLISDWSADKIKKFEEIEKKSHKIIVTKGDFVFYLTFWQNKWYLTVIDRFEACSA